MVGKRIKELREEIGLSQTDLANRIGESKQTLYKYENNLITNVPSDKIEALSYELGCSPAYLMGWIDTPNIPKPLDTFEAYMIREIHAHFTQDELEDPVLSKQIVSFMDFLKKLDPKGRDSLLAFAKTLKF